MWPESGSQLMDGRGSAESQGVLQLPYSLQVLEQCHSLGGSEAHCYLQVSSLPFFSLTMCDLLRSVFFRDVAPENL